MCNFQKGWFWLSYSRLTTMQNLTVISQTLRACNIPKISGSWGPTA